MLLAVYGDNGSGQPDELLAKTEETAINAAEGWQTVQLNIPIDISEGDTIWLAWVFENNPGTRYRAVYPTARYVSSSGFGDGMPSDFGTSSSAYGMKFSIYAVYTSKAQSPELIGNPYMFTGRRFDLETGLYYYRARYYNPQIGRFLQTDPIGYSDGMNWYNYCANNPVGCVDPSGLWWAGDPYNNGIWMQDYASSCGPATIVNTLWNLFPEGKFDDGDPLPTEKDIRIKFEQIIKPKQSGHTGTDEGIWGEQYTKGCNYFLKGGRGVTMEEVLEVLNDILSANKTGKQYKMIKGGAWSLDDIDKGVESGGPVIHGIAWSGNNAHVAMIAAKGECDGVDGYWHVSSVRTSAFFSPEDWIDEYLRNDFLYRGKMVNSYDVPILVPNW